MGRKAPLSERKMLHAAGAKVKCLGWIRCTKRYNCGANPPFSRLLLSDAVNVPFRVTELLVSYPALPYPISAYTRGAEFARRLGQQILILDGAMGTMIQRYKLGEADFRGERFADHHKDVKGNCCRWCALTSSAKFTRNIWPPGPMSSVPIPLVQQILPRATTICRASVMT